MSIKSDAYLIKKCTPPSHRAIVSGLKSGFGWVGVDFQLADCTADGRVRVHSTLYVPVEPADLDSFYLQNPWFPLIAPFFGEQVRSKEVPRTMSPQEELYHRTLPLEEQTAYRASLTATEKTISYGVSSYGYDVQCAEEFKVFTNINNSLIDPKNFDPAIFVDVKGPKCIIPPNSFALARTVEWFKIPRNVLTVCLGKSTYARCFTGDTHVALVDGTSASFIELVDRAEKGEKLFGYSADANGNLVVSELTAPRKVGHEKVLAVQLDNGEVIRCTPDHKFMTRDGEYVEAQHLTDGQSLMPLYRGVTRGYEAVYQPNAGLMISTHWLADAWNLRNGVYSVAEEKIQRHHVDHMQRNNRPDNIIRLSAKEHAAHHNEERWATEESRLEHGVKISQAIAQLMDDDEWFANYSAQQSKRASAFWNSPEHAQARQALLEKRQITSEETRNKHRKAMLDRFTSKEERILHSERMRKVWSGDDVRKQRQGLIAKMINLRDEITEVVVKQALAITGSIRGAARYLKCDRSVFRRFPDVMSEFHGGVVANNHKVISVTEVEGTHDVYCLTVPEFGNFALESGVIVKNCGIIVNVTPLEPEWEGHVTLEFSNTTNLPAVIYANEGVAQMLFFESDEVCLTSYKDRGGKYQGQSGVVVPRMK